MTLQPDWQTSEFLTVRHSVPCDLSFATATVRASSITETDNEHSVEAVLATQNATVVLDMQRMRTIDEILLVRGFEFGDQITLLDDHAGLPHRAPEGNDAVLGSARNLRTQNDQLIGRLFFTIGDDRADRIWRKVAQGHLRDVSIGYKSIEYVDIPPGQSRNVAGTVYTAGVRVLRITTRAIVREVSVTPVGADRFTKIRSDAGLPLIEGDAVMSTQLRQYLESIGLRSEANEQEAWTFYNSLSGDNATRAAQINAESRRVAQDPPASNPGGAAPLAGGDPPAGHRAAPSQPAAPAQPAAQAVAQPAATATLDLDAVRREAAQTAQQNELNRISSIRALAGDETRDEWVEHCITHRGDGGAPMTVEQAEIYLLRQEREARQPAVSGAPAHRIGGEDANFNTRSISAALANYANGDGMEVMTRSGLSQTEAEEACGRADRLVVTGIFDVVRMCVDQMGLRDPESGAPPNTIEGYVRAATSTMTVSNVFSTSIHARLMQAFEAAPDSTGWCQYTDVVNFQTQERTAYGKSSKLDKLNRGDTAKHTTIGDLQETFKIHRYAKQLVVDEQDVLDNNLDKFNILPVEMGEAAAEVRPDLVYALLLANASLGQDSIALFHSSHANTATDTLNSAGIKTGTSAMQKQTQDGRNLNIMSEHLIVNTDLRWTAQELMESGQIIITGTTDSERGNANVIRGTLQIHSEPRLVNGVTDPNTGTAYSGSSTNWFLAGRRRTIEVAHLSGTGRRPSLRRFILDKGQWGFGWDIKFDCGVKALAYQTLYRGNV